MTLFRWSEHRSLLLRLVRRDIASRYQGSAFGALWSLASPLMLLAAYWFVLGEVLGARWEGVSPKMFPIVLFAGLMVYIFFSEVVGRSASLVIDNASYVKKVVFPLEILSPMVLMTALFHFVISCCVLWVGQLLLTGSVSLTWIFVPVIIAPLVLMALGFSWAVSSLAVYLRDLQQIVPLVLTLLMFLSPIFYPIGLVPKRYLAYLQINPITIPIEQVRRVVVEGLAPDWDSLFMYTIASALVMGLGGLCFMRSRVGFSDVL